MIGCSFTKYSEGLELISSPHLSFEVIRVYEVDRILYSVKFHDIIVLFVLASNTLSDHRYL